MQKSMKCKKIIYFIVSTILLLLAIVIGRDTFTHGYYYDEIDIVEAANDLGSPVDLTEETYEMHFSPGKDHFAGFVIMFINQTVESKGTIFLDIENESGSRLERIAIDISKVKDKTWYKTYCHANLKKDQIYTLKFSINAISQTAPQIVTIDTDYLSGETIDGNAAIVYAYEEPVFNVPTKVLLCLIMFSLWLYITSAFIVAEKKKSFFQYQALFVFMTSILAWNYMFNSMDNSNTQFDNFQEYSETLVTGPMYAEQDGIGITSLQGFGLGRYYDELGGYFTNKMAPIDDANWNEGYSRTEPAIIINSNLYTCDAVKDLSEIRFGNGDIFTVAEVKDDGTNIVIKMNSSRNLNPDKYGRIKDIIFIGSQGEEKAGSLLVNYTSQFGLQGKIFRSLARYMSGDIGGNIDNLHLLCSLTTAAVFVIITLLLQQKYNNIMAGVFYVTFWLSPWVVNFARNLYWVEFTWFIPMAIGLVCSLKLTDRKWRIGCYIATFVAITGKCLCGYEYITSVMMGLIAFLLVDLIMAFLEGNKERFILLFRTIFILGVTSLIGFATAICIHAPLIGNGDILGGIRAIILNCVIARTSGGDLNYFAESLWTSFNASTWDVYCTYFKFSTAVITGITGNLFPLLCCIPLLLFAYNYRRKKLNREEIALYIVFFLTSVSWFILAKSHSYIHTHMNYVMWYFGFVQICLYICVNKLVEAYKNLKGDER